MQNINFSTFQGICKGEQNPGNLLKKDADEKLYLHFKEFQMSEATVIYDYFKYPILFENCNLDRVITYGNLKHSLEIDGGRLGAFRSDGNLMGLLIKNAEVENNFLLSGSASEIQISNSKFNGSITIGGGTYDRNFNIERCQLVGVNLNSGIFKKDLLINECVLANSLYINDGTFERNLKLSSLSVAYLSIEKGLFLTKVDFEKINCSKTCTIEGGKFPFQLKITDGNYNNFWFEGGEFENVVFDGKGQYSELSIEGGVYKNIQFKGGIFKDVTLETFEVKGQVDFEGGEYSNVEFDLGFDSKNKFYFYSLDKGEPKVQTISIYQIGSSYMNISSGIYNSLVFGDNILHKDASVQISDVLFHQVLFENYNNHGYINFNGVSHTPQKFTPSNDNYISTMAVEDGDNSIFSIINSSLGKLEFIGCDLSGFEKFIFENSKILDVFIAGTKMPKTLSITTPEDKGKLYAQQRLGYGQLKKICEARGEQVEAVYYHAQQMEALKKTYTWKNNTFEKFTLFLNNISNEHGKNWPRALAFTAILSFISFGLYSGSLFWSMKGAYMDFSQTGWDNFWRMSCHIFEFILPLHKFGFMEDAISPIKLPENFLSATIDILGRIFISYGIYQLINAFRKHGKSNV